MQELPTTLIQRIQSLASAGDALATEHKYEAAVGNYNEAWALVPEPKSNWEASTWLLTAIGDACFLANYFTSGAEALRYATVCPGGFGNPYIHMRLGQCEFELNNLDAATDQLLRAYALAGKELFASENAKYFAFLQSRVEPPAGGAW